MKSMNVLALDPLFVAYSRAHGRTPEDQLAYDTVRYPSTRLIRYLTWVDMVWECFTLMTGIRRCSAAQASFDAWIQKHQDRIGLPRTHAEPEGARLLA